MIVELTLTNQKTHMIELPEDTNLEEISRSVRMCVGNEGSIVFKDIHGYHHIYPSRSIYYIRCSKGS